VKPLRVKVSVKNNILISLREAEGLTQAKLAWIIGVPKGCISDFENLRLAPYTKDSVNEPSRLRRAAELLAGYFGKAVEELWPEELAHATMAKREFTFEMSLEQARRIAESPADELDRAKLVVTMRKLLETLTPREQFILQQHFFEEKNFDEIGEQLDVNRCRVIQIAVRALRKLQHPSRSIILEPYRQLSGT